VQFEISQYFLKAQQNNVQKSYVRAPSPKQLQSVQNLPCSYTWFLLHFADGQGDGVLVWKQPLCWVHASNVFFGWQLEHDLIYFEFSVYVQFIHKT